MTLQEQFAAARDITDQKRAEDAIAEGRRLLQMVIDTVPADALLQDDLNSLPSVYRDWPLASATQFGLQSH